MENQTAPAKQVKVDDTVEILHKILMVFIFVLTVSMFSYWGFQAVMYMLSVSFGVFTGFTPYDMFIGIIAMISSAMLFVGSIMWWTKNVKAEKLLKYGALGFIIKSILEIPNAIVPLTRLSTVNIYDLTKTASVIGIDLLKMAFWIFVLFVFVKAIKKYKASKAA